MEERGGMGGKKIIQEVKGMRDDKEWNDTDKVYYVVRISTYTLDSPPTSQFSDPD